MSVPDWFNLWWAEVIRQLRDPNVTEVVLPAEQFESDKQLQEFADLATPDLELVFAAAPPDDSERLYGHVTISVRGRPHDVVNEAPR